MTSAGSEPYHGARPDRPGAPAARGNPATPRRPRRWARTVAFVLLGLFVLFLVGSVSTYFWASGKLTKIGALTEYSGRPVQGGGTNWLIVGSDSRSTLTPAQKQQYHVGSVAGQRSDTILLLHYGASGPDLISIPRDSYATIPAYTDSSGATHGASKNKINAAYDLGGPQLLVRAVEQATDVRIDHYLEIGFLGVVNVVNAVGGVDMCLPSAVHDSYSGADLPAGCQTLNGQQALALVRSRYSLPDSDISRMADQQDFVSAMVQSTLRPGVLGNPFVFYPLLAAMLDSVAVDDGTSVWSLLDLAWNSKTITGGRGTVGTVPIADQGYQVSGVGSTVVWNSAKAQQLFAAVNADEAIPAGLLNSLG
ncbi:MAG TPA: LCP family protein [Actinocrinis sp.]|nr:LCP family protein [Actinocrinis sp.]